VDEIIALQNPHWNQASYNNLMERDIFQTLVAQLELSEILVLQGIRRCGKSTLFQLLINELMSTVDPKKILYVNLDDPFFTQIHLEPKSFYKITQTAEKLTDQKVEYLFLDEVQNIDGWEKFVKSTYDSKQFKKIFITGSNSSLLSSDYATLLTGRYIKEQIYPLTFNEIMANTGVTDKIQLVAEKPRALKITDDILQYGSFPKIYKTKNVELKRKLLISYYETIIFKDCIDNNQIRESKKFKELSHYMISHSGSTYSYKSLSKAMESSDMTIKDFIHIEGYHLLS